MAYAVQVRVGCSRGQGEIDIFNGHETSVRVEIEGAGGTRTLGTGEGVLIGSLADGEYEIVMFVDGRGEVARTTETIDCT